MPIHADDRESINAYLGDYTPRFIPTELWSGPLAAFVRWHVIGLDVNFFTARRIIRELAQIGAFCLRNGIPLEIDYVLDPDTVERFIDEGTEGIGSTSKATLRSDLRMLGPMLTVNAPWQPKPEALSRKTLAQPYTQRQTKLICQTTTQKGVVRTIATRSMICLGFGAGLDGRWLPRITGKDVRRSGSFIVVTVPEPHPREVVVRAEFEDELIRLAHNAGDRVMLAPSGNGAKNTASKLAQAAEFDQGRIRLNASRMRSTWLVAHLSAGTPMRELIEAAGVKGFGSFDDLLPFVPALPKMKSREWLRGAA